MDQDHQQAMELAGPCEAQQLEAWASTQLAMVDLGDARRNDRLVSLLTVMAQRPGKSLPQQCEHDAPLKAAYRLLDCPALKHEELIASSAAATVEQLQARPVTGMVLSIQDTTSLNFTTHEALAGRGPIGNNSKTQGFFAHTSLLVGEQGPVHGLLECEVYARDQAAQKARKCGERNRMPAAQKESQRWVRSARHSAQLCELLPGSEGVVSIADREADMYELLIEARQLCEQHGGRYHLLVRAQHDRELEDHGQRLWEHLARQPAEVCWQIETPAPKGLHGVRQRRVEALWQKVSLAVPAHQKKYQGCSAPVELTVIIVREPSPPPDSEALEWVLLTTWPVSDAEGARRVAGWYARRWQIEVMHRVWKSGCKVEQRRLREPRAAQVMIVLDLLTAVMLMGLVSQARHQPDASVEGWLSNDQCTVLRHQFENEKTGTAGRPLTIAQAVRWIAQLGGHRRAPSSPPPGADTLWRGQARLHDITLGWRLASQVNKCG